MSKDEENESGKLSLSGTPRRTLQLRKSVDTGQVRQSFSRGRTKTVLVERRRKRVRPKDLAEDAPVETQPTAPVPTPREVVPPEPDIADDADIGRPSRPRVVLKTLTDDEKAVRAKALRGATAAANLARQRADEEARRRAQEEEQLAVERAAAEQRRAEEETRKRAEEEARQKAEAEAARRLSDEPAGSTGAGATAARTDAGRGFEPPKPGAKRRGAAAPRFAARRGQERRRTGKLTLAKALAGDDERQRSLAAMRRARAREKRAAMGVAEPPKKVLREVVIPDAITVQDLAGRMAERAPDVIKTLMNMGVMATINETLDADTAELVVGEFGHKAKRVSEADVEIGVIGDEDRPENMRSRPSVVTVMGHVDHGKTSLLDALRRTDVASGEAGGITQHIGAYQVDTGEGRKITFIDTPGHAAFTAMRARGAQVTDIVVLVVAADDGIMPQTVEAINHAKAAGVPIIVAINKIDKPGADPDRVRQGLLQQDLVVEKLGGDILDVEVSATQNINLDRLQEAILLQAELMELKANPNRPGEGVVIEAKLDKGRGVVATVLVQRGTIRVGDVVVAGTEWGRLRALDDDQGTRLDAAGPSQPVEVLGLGGAPVAGDSFAVVENEARAREISEFRRRQKKLKASAVHTPASTETLFSKIGEDQLSELPVVIKADMQGSVEAIDGSLTQLATDEVAVFVLHGAVGAITEADVTLAQSSGAVIIGFNVRATKQARDLAQKSGVEIRYYSVIYDLVDDIKKALSGMLAPAIKETLLGTARVQEVFAVSKAGKAAGCVVTEGVVRTGAKARLVRDGTVVYDGRLSSVRRFKDEVKEVASGTECGIAFENFQDIKAGDTVEVYEIEEVERSL